MSWPAVILGIDPGAISGWAVHSPEGLRAARTARTASERREAVEAARTLAGAHRLPLVAVGEAWQGGASPKRRNVKTLAGIGAAWGRWAEQLELAGVPKRRILRVQTNEWRKAVLGGRAFRRTDQWKSAAISLCRARWPTGAPPSRLPWEDMPDACEAALIGLWATEADAVREVLPKGRA